MTETPQDGRVWFSGARKYPDGQMFKVMAALATFALLLVVSSLSTRPASSDLKLGPMTAPVTPKVGVLTLVTIVGCLLLLHLSWFGLIIVGWRQDALHAWSLYRADRRLTLETALQRHLRPSEEPRSPRGDRVLGWMYMLIWWVVPALFSIGSAAFALNRGW